MFWEDPSFPHIPSNDEPKEDLVNPVLSIYILCRNRSCIFLCFFAITFPKLKIFHKKWCRRSSQHKKVKMGRDKLTIRSRRQQLWLDYWHICRCMEQWDRKQNHASPGRNHKLCLVILQTRAFFRVLKMRGKNQNLTHTKNTIPTLCLGKERRKALLSILLFSLPRPFFPFAPSGFPAWTLTFVPGGKPSNCLGFLNVRWCWVLWSIFSLHVKNCSLHLVQRYIPFFC